MRSISKLKGGFTFAMHGAGAYSGCVHTNTREAFEYWRKRGVNVFEIDVGVDDNYEEGIAFAHLMNRDTDWICKELNPRLVDPDKCNICQIHIRPSYYAIIRYFYVFEGRPRPNHYV